MRIYPNFEVILIPHQLQSFKGICMGARTGGGFILLYLIFFFPFNKLKFGTELYLLYVIRKSLILNV